MSSLKVALYDSSEDAAPVAFELSWAELVEYVTSFPDPKCSVSGEGGLPPCRGRTCPAKDGPAWSPVIIEGKRANGNVSAITCAVLDLDHAADLAVIEASVSGFAYALHSTHSHSKEDACYRLVLPLSRPALPSEWPDVRRVVIESLGLAADPQTKDLSRLYFLPTRREGAPSHASSSLIGEAVDVDEALALARSKPTLPAAPVAYDLASLRATLVEVRRSKASRGAGSGLDAQRSKAQAEVLGRVLDGEPLAQPGERDGTLLRATGILAFWLPAGVPWEVAREILRPSVAAMDTEPEGLEHWLGVAEQKFERQVKIREASDARRQADAAALSEFTKALSSKPMPTPAHVEAAGGSWERALILNDRDEVKVCEHNAHVLLSCAPELRNTLRWNSVTRQIAVFGGPFADAPTSSLAGVAAAWLQRHYDFMANEKLVGASILRVARENAWDPIAEYLGELAWDGVDRAETFLETYLGAVTTDAPALKYVRAVSKRWLISLVARALQPGCKVDTVLILEGPQGIGKSSALEAIVGPEFFLDAAFEIGSKDSMQAIGGAWLVELAELASFRKAETLKIRQFMTTKVDKFRPPYGAVTEVFPRRNVFAGTTNSERYLTDREGNRRYWPVTVGSIDLEGIKRDRDQLLAEAVELFRAGERWHLTDDESQIAANETENRVDESSVEEAIDRWWYATVPSQRPVRLFILDVAEAALKTTPERVDHRMRTEVGQALRRLGFQRKGKEKYYKPTDEMLAAPVRVTARAAGNLALVKAVNESTKVKN